MNPPGGGSRQMRASPSFFSSSNGLAAASEAEAETGGVRVWEIAMDTSTTLARAKALPIRVEFKRHLVLEESRATDGYAGNRALDRIYSPLSGSQEEAKAGEGRRGGRRDPSTRCARSGQIPSSGIWLTIRPPPPYVFCKCGF